MPTLSIESNGRLEKSAVYYNGEQLAGIKELYLNLDEDGTFDAIIQYEGSNRNIYTRQIFSESLIFIKTSEPSFTEEEARELQLFSIESDGDINSAAVFQNNDMLEGVVSVFIHIKATKNKSSLLSLFKSVEYDSEDTVFTAQITFRNEDETLETEDIF